MKDESDPYFKETFAFEVDLDRFNVEQVIAIRIPSHPTPYTLHPTPYTIRPTP